MRKRIIAMFTTLVMLISFVPTIIFADNNPDGYMKNITLSAEHGIVKVRFNIDAVTGNPDDCRYVYGIIWNTGEEYDLTPASNTISALEGMKFLDPWYFQPETAYTNKNINGTIVEDGDPVELSFNIKYGDGVRSAVLYNLTEKTETFTPGMTDQDVVDKIVEFNSEDADGFQVSHTWKLTMYTYMGNWVNKYVTTFTLDDEGNLAEEEKTYTINYDANGGTGATLNTDTWNNKSGNKDGVTLPTSAGTKSGYKFAGWSTKSNPTASDVVYTTNYKPNSGDADESNNVTLYAVWKEIATVRYDANGGTGSVTDTTEYEAGDKIKLKAATGLVGPADKPNFDGWQFNGAKYQPNDEITLAGGENVVTAQWVAKYTATVTAQNMSVDYTGTPVAKSELVKKITVNGSALTDADVDKVTIKCGGSETIPTDVGNHTLNITYEDATHTGTATMTLTIKAVKKAVPTITEKGKTPDSVTVNVTDGAKYMIKKSSEAAPTIASGTWETATSTDIVKNGLEPNTKYTVYAFTPGGGNYADSDIVKKEITTESLAQNTLKLTVNKTEVQYGDEFTVTATDVNNTNTVNFPENPTNAKRISVSGNVATYKATNSTGSVTVTVEQAASSTVNGATVTSDSVTLKQRTIGLDFSGLQAVDKVYDGTDSAQINATVRANAMPTIIDEVAIADGVELNSCVGKFATKNASDTAQDVTLVITLKNQSEAPAKHYKIPTDIPKLSAKITKRNVKVSLKNNVEKTYGSVLSLTAAEHLSAEAAVHNDGLLSSETITDLKITAIQCDGTPADATAGDYPLSSVTAGESNYNVTLDTASTNKVIVKKKAMDKPTIGSAYEITANSFKAAVTNGAKYVIKKSTDPAPTVGDSSAWATSDGTVTKTDCDAKTTYIIYAYTPAADSNHADSEIVKSGNITTLNTSYTADMFEIANQVYNTSEWSKSEIAGLISKKSSISATVGAVTVTGVESKTSSSVTTAKNADTYTVTFDVAGNAEYSAASGLKLDWVISKAEQTLTLDKTSPITLTQGSTEEITVTKTDEIPWSNITVASADGGKVGVSPTTLTSNKFNISGVAVSTSNVAVTVTSAATANYNSATATLLATVNARPLDANTLTVVSNKSSVSYGDEFTVTASNKNNTNAISFPTSVANAVRVSTTDDGLSATYRATGSTGNASVTITQAATDLAEGVTKTVNVALTKRRLNIANGTLNAENKVYDGTKTASITGSAALTNAVSGDDISLTNVKGDFAAANVGNSIGVTLTASLDGAAKEHYEMGELPSGLSADITPRPVNVWLKTDINKPYGSTITINVSNLEAQATETNSGLAPGKDISDLGITSIACNGTASNSEPGNYPILSVTGSGNYTISVTGDKKVIVGERPSGTNNTFTVKFDANGGTGDTMTPMNVVIGNAVTLTANTYTKDGYKFVGWAYTTDGTGTVWNDGANVTFTQDNDGNALADNSVVTLYAVWKKCYTLTVNAGNGGDYASVNGERVTEAKTFADGDSVNVTVTAKSGFKFKEWQASGITLDSTTKKLQSLTIPVNGDITLTAVFVSELVLAPKTSISKTTANIGSLTLADFVDSATPLFDGDSISGMFGGALRNNGSGGVFTANGVTVKFYTDNTYATVDSSLTSIPTSEGAYYYTVEVTEDKDNMPKEYYTLKQLSPAQGVLNVEKKSTGGGGGGGGTIKPTPKPTEKPTEKPTDKPNGNPTETPGGTPSNPINGTGNRPSMFSAEHKAYIVGRDGGYIAPSENITRAEVATVFFRLLTDEVREANYTRENPFEDSNADDWYNSAVSTLAKLGIVYGRTGVGYQPNEFITRAEFVTIAVRFANDEWNGGDMFGDISEHWARSYINTAASKQWIVGNDGMFRPDENITRAEVMAIVNRMLERQPQSKEDLLEGMNEWIDNNESDWYYLDVQEATNSHEYELKSDNVHEKWTKLTAAPDWESFE